MTTVEIWTDGAVSIKKKNSPGGFGCAYVYEGVLLETLSGGEYNTTSQRMELMGVIAGLENAFDYKKINNLDVSVLDIKSDSAYIIDCMEGTWYREWIKNDWTSSDGVLIKNRDLWQRLLLAVNFLTDRGILITWSKIKGHSGLLFNEVADKLAVNAKKNL